MIYITGDTHNTIDMSNLSSKNIRLCCMEQKVVYHKISIAIVLGDFGLPWSSDCSIDGDGIHPTDHTDRYLLKWYNEKPFKVFAVMGNHDNYDLLEQLPEVNMFGAKVLKVSDNVFYFKRGEVYKIEGKSFLVLGGALSTDKVFRTIRESWWPQEEWTEDEKKTCLSKIDSAGCNFDYVLSHTGPSTAIALTDSYYTNEEHLPELFEDSNVIFNDKIDSITTYKKWFFGHWHSDWGYENFEKSKYVPLYHRGRIL